jgi:hypothetical protein
MSVATSIPDTSLGLTSSEIQILRQQQQIALQGGHAASVSRGRGSGRNSTSSSRAASAASSQGRLLLDPMSLRALSHQLDHLQEQIRDRIEYVCHHHFAASLVLSFVTLPVQSSPLGSISQYQCLLSFRAIWKMRPPRLDFLSPFISLIICQTKLL